VGTSVDGTRIIEMSQWHWAVSITVLNHRYSATTTMCCHTEQMSDQWLKCKSRRGGMLHSGLGIQQWSFAFL